jgi:hypothetical protein
VNVKLGALLRFLARHRALGLPPKNVLAFYFTNAYSLSLSARTRPPGAFILATAMTLLVELTQLFRTTPRTLQAILR